MDGLNITLTIDLAPLLDARTRRTLNPNGRAHWATRAAAARVVRGGALVLTRSELAKLRLLGGTVAEARLDFSGSWPGAALMDTDNCWTMLKPARDGVADALYPDLSPQVRDNHIAQGSVALRSLRSSATALLTVHLSVA